MISAYEADTKIAGCIVRVAGHDFMDFRYSSDSSTGGSDGCINFNDEDNAGLSQCLQGSGLPEIFEDFCS